MSRFVRQSQLRNLVVEPQAPQAAWSELRAADVASGGDLVAASATHLAFVEQGAGGTAVGVTRVDRPGKQADLRPESCQQGAVLDLAFSPHDPALLSSAAADGTVAIWRAQGDSGCPVALHHRVTLGLASNTRVVCARWAPSVEGIVAAVAGKKAVIWDVNRQSEPVALAKLSAPLLDACWLPASNGVMSLNTDRTIALFDPRHSGASAETHEAHTGRAAGRIVSGGASSHGQLEHYVYTTGTNHTRDRELAGWDVRNLSHPIFRAKIGGGTSSLIPVVVPDTKILFLVGKGETSVRAYELSHSKPFVFNLSTVSSGSAPALGVATLPSAACDFMACEVARLVKLTASAIEPLRVEIPRRSKAVFHEEIFPPSVDLYNAALLAEEWLGGAEAMQQLVPVQSLAQGLGAPQVAELAIQNAAHEEAEEETRQRSAVRNSAKPAVSTSAYIPNTVDKRMTRIMGYVPKFKYASGSAAKKDLTVYNLRPGTVAALACNSDRFALPWQGGGGPIFVGALANPGKIDAPEQAPVLNGHTKQVFCLDFSPFGDNLLASGSDDCTVRAWRLPPDPQADPSESASVSLAGHQSSVRIVKFHPNAKKVLASASTDGTVRLWDVRAGTEAGVALEDLPPVTSLDWAWNGSHMAVMDRDNIMHVLDPRESRKAGASATQRTHLGAKPCNLCWLGDTSKILTSGCARMGFREFSVWDGRKLGAPLNTTKIGAGALSYEPLFVEENGVVLFFARGENTIHIYELEDLSRAPLKPDHPATEPFKPHKCTEYVAPGEPTSHAALIPRRALDTSKAEFARVLRLTPSVVEPISFTIPRAADIAEYFADDIYAETRAPAAALKGADWLAGKNARPVLESMMPPHAKRLSKRDPKLAHAALRRGRENAARFRRELDEEEQRRMERDEALERMQRLAVQYEAYNPNLSTGTSKNAAVPLEDDDVDEAEWDD